MAAKNLDIRKLVASIRGRNGYMAGSALVLIVAVLALARFAPPAPAPVVADAPAADSARAAADAAAAEAAVAEAEAEAAAAEADSAASDARRPVALPDRPFAFEPITDGVPRVSKPDVVRGLYLNAWAAGSTRKLAKLIDIANRTEINTFVIDVKEAGEISYRSRIPAVRALGSDRAYIRDVRGMLRQLRENGIYPIARIVLFRDAVLANARPDWAIRHVDGGDWRDPSGHAWVDSFNREVWDYNIAIAREALELGFSEVQWDYVRFPDVPMSIMRTAEWPAREGRSKEDAIREFLLYSREQLSEYGAPVTADVFGLTLSARDGLGIGQLWEKMVDATDVLLPMIYPSHFARGTYGIAHPNGQPFEIIRTALGFGVRRTPDTGGAATIRPWLQDFTLGPPRYGPEHVRAQIEGVYAAGLQEWVLWHPGSNYTVEALASADGVPPDLILPGSEAEAEAEEAKKEGPLGTPVRVEPPPADTGGR